MARSSFIAMEPTFPIPDNRAVTRSNLDPNRLDDVRRTRMTDRSAPLQQANARYQRDLKRLLRKADLKRAKSIVADLKRDFRQASLAARGDAAKWEAQRKAVRGKQRRLVARAVPRYREVRALQRRHGGQLEKLAAAWRDIHTPPIGDILEPPLDPNTTIFKPPFSLVDVYVWKGGDQHSDVTNRSFVLPDSGQLILDADFDDNEHTSFSDGLWGLLYVNIADVVTSCGVPYTVPDAGRLRITAEFRNFYNQALMSLRDNWGFSSGTLSCHYWLFGSVMRPSRESVQYVRLFDNKLTSDGDDVSALMPDIDQSAPLYLDTTTDDSFNQGEPVWLMVGSLVEVYSRLDDMHSHVRALLWWQVNQIAVSVVPIIIL
ncbi:MAG TPA: hypothetical protein VEL51_21180 [Vicinamibacterales bacterium]|nr:hypothetical protein [Vicinamibacterales bacterium]